MKGLHARGKDCTVVKRTSFTGSDGRTVYQMQLEGHGFNHTFTTGDKAEADLWPAQGIDVHLTTKLEPMKGGGFKLGVAMFEDVRTSFAEQAEQRKSAAKQPQLA